MKQFINVLLSGAMFFSIGTFTSCGDDDVDDLKSRVTVLEGAIGEMKDQLSNAITVGASILDVEQNNGVYTFKLSNGENIVINTGGGGNGGGGSNITVVIKENNVIITVDGIEYVIPMGSAVNSLIYSPEYTDGMVRLGNDGATVRLLATPAITASDLEKATFDITEAHELKLRSGNGLLKIEGDVTLDGDFLVVHMKGLSVEASKSYAAAVLMDLNGTLISSNYFTVVVSDDFSFNAEQIGGYTIKAEYNPVDLADNFAEMTVNGFDLLGGVTNFKNLFSTLPDNAEFVIASKSAQPGGQAQEKWDLLNKSLAKDGTWAFSQRPGTSFNDNADRKGFLFNVVAEDVIKAKIYVVIKDELADVDFVGQFTAQAEAEWGGREKSLKMGAQEVNIQETFAKYTEDYTIIHNGEDGFFKQWEGFGINEGEVIYSDGEKLQLGDLGKKYAALSRGVYWFCRGFAIYVPEALADENNKYLGSDGKTYSGAEGYGYDFWGKQGVEFTTDSEGYMLSEASPWGITMTKDGVLKFPATYTGYGLRLAIGACYEYAYGVKKLGKEDQFGLYFFNRRMAPEGTTMPAPKP